MKDKKRNPKEDVPIIIIIIINPLLRRDLIDNSE